VINLHTSNVEVEHLITLIKQKIKHTYLEQYIDIPAIDKYKLTILTNIINQSNLSELKKQHYIITTMLVQIALDTHDMVPITNDRNETKSDRTSRQLTVLAGDYFSGIYYFLLSETEDIELIQLMATTIKEISELKMKRYYKEVNSFKEFILIEQKIESLLITEISNFVNVPVMNQVNDLLLITNKLINEKISFYQKDQTPLLEKWVTNTVPSTYTPILDKIDTVIDEKFKLIQKGLIQLPQTLQANIQSLTEELVTLNNKVTKEG